MQDNRDNHPLDLSYLKEMAGHDPELMIEFFEIFIEQTPLYMAELENALSIKDWKKVADCAHKIKPTLAYIGRGDVKDFIDYIETSSKSEKKLHLIPEKVSTLQLILDKIYLQIDGAIKELRP